MSKTKYIITFSIFAILLIGAAFSLGSFADYGSMIENATNSSIIDDIQNATEQNVSVEAPIPVENTTDESHTVIVENETVAVNGTLSNATIKPIVETPKDPEPLPPIPEGKHGIQITDVHPLDSDKVEYINITNYMTTTAHLEGFKIRDVACNNTLIFPADFDIKSGKTLRIYSGSGESKPCKFYLDLKHHYINKKDRIELYCSCGNKTSEFSVGGY
jgi:hypothetical protein